MSVQLTPVERKRRKRFTAQQKRSILREWEASGNGVEVAERQGIHPTTLYRWRKRLETGVGFSPGRAARPTDNAREERFYRTLKQEEIYCNRDYLSLESAGGAIARYIDYYNENRPHQALFGYTTALVHTSGNKTRLVEKYRQKVRQAQEKRLLRKVSTDHQQPTPSFS